MSNPIRPDQQQANTATLPEASVNQSLDRSTAPTATTPAVTAEVSDAGAAKALAGVEGQRTSDFDRYSRMMKDPEQGPTGAAAALRSDLQNAQTPKAARTAHKAFKAALTRFTSAHQIDAETSGNLAKVESWEAQLDASLSAVHRGLANGEPRALATLRDDFDQLREEAQQARAAGNTDLADLLDKTRLAARTEIMTPPAASALPANADLAEMTSIGANAQQIIPGDTPSTAVAQLAFELDDEGVIDNAALIKLGLDPKADRDGQKAHYRPGTAMAKAVDQLRKGMQDRGIHGIPDVESGVIDQEFLKHLRGQVIYDRVQAHPNLLKSIADKAQANYAAGTTIPAAEPKTSALEQTGFGAFAGHFGETGTAVPGDRTQSTLARSVAVRLYDSGILGEDALSELDIHRGMGVDLDGNTVMSWDINDAGNPKDPTLGAYTAQTHLAHAVVAIKEKMGLSEPGNGNGNANIDPEFVARLEEFLTPPEVDTEAAESFGSGFLSATKDVAGMAVGAAGFVGDAIDFEPSDTQLDPFADPKASPKQMANALQRRWAATKFLGQAETPGIMVQKAGKHFEKHGVVAGTIKGAADLATPLVETAKAGTAEAWSAAGAGVFGLITGGTALKVLKAARTIEFAGVAKKAAAALEKAGVTSLRLAKQGGEHVAVLGHRAGVLLKIDVPTAIAKLGDAAVVKYVGKMAQHLDPRHLKDLGKTVQADLNAALARLEDLTQGDGRLAHAAAAAGTGTVAADRIGDAADGLDQARNLNTLSIRDRLQRLGDSLPGGSTRRARGLARQRKTHVFKPHDGDMSRAFNGDTRQIKLMERINDLLVNPHPEGPPLDVAETIKRAAHELDLPPRMAQSIIDRISVPNSNGDSLAHGVRAAFEEFDQAAQRVLTGHQRSGDADLLDLEGPRRFNQGFGSQAAREARIQGIFDNPNLRGDVNIAHRRDPTPLNIDRSHLRTDLASLRELDVVERTALNLLDRDHLLAVPQQRILRNHIKSRVADASDTRDLQTLQRELATLANHFSEVRRLAEVQELSNSSLARQAALNKVFGDFMDHYIKA